MAEKPFPVLVLGNPGCRGTVLYNETTERPWDRRSRGSLSVASWTERPVHIHELVERIRRRKRFKVPQRPPKRRRLGVRTDDLHELVERAPRHTQTVAPGSRIPQSVSWTKKRSFLARDKELGRS